MLVALKDTKKQNNINTIRKLESENKILRQEIRKHKTELKTIEQEKTRIQNIFKSKTQKQAQQRFNTIYNRRKQLPPIFQTFLKNMKKDLDILINHIENKDIPATNNIV